ncbi:FAD-binding oxidoreductase [Candidatus Bathyarchaeota archaeon]|nr:FAD-binding oxidoreductase [Candidatus Bathyarchaeota archaeon]
MVCMSFQSKILDELKAIVGPDRVSVSPEVCLAYAFNPFWGRDIIVKPDIVILPKTPEEISQILKVANSYRVPVTPKGAVGGGGHGGPLKGGILLDLSLMDNILLIDTANMKAIAEAGCSFFKLSQEVFKRGMLLPTAAYGSGPSVAASAIDPAYAFGGTRYGGNINLVEGLEVVLPSGEIVRVGSMAYLDSEFGPYHRYITGPDLVGLFTRSNGAFGIITKVAYRCLRKPKFWAFKAFAWPRDRLKECIHAAAEATSIEVFDIHFNNRARWELKPNGPKIPEDLYFVLTIAINGFNELELRGREKEVEEICESYGGRYLPEVGEDFHAIWPCDFLPEEKILPPRYSLPAKIPRSYVFLFDELIHPLSWMPQIYEKMSELCAEYGLSGLVVDGFILNNLCSSTQFTISLNDSDPDVVKRYRQCQNEFRKWFLERGGTFQYRLPPYVPDKVWTNQLGAFKILKKIKGLLDPNNILSPGTFELFEEVEADE